MSDYRRIRTHLRYVLCGMYVLQPRVVTLTASLPMSPVPLIIIIFCNEPDYPYLYYINSYTGGVRDECPFIGFVNGTQVVSGQRYGYSDVDYLRGYFQPWWAVDWSTLSRSVITVIRPTHSCLRRRHLLLTTA
jgi:hypothetical protein